MNNVTFGNEKGGYYETVGGGAGAGPGWAGRSGVHTHVSPFLSKTFIDSLNGPISLIDFKDDQHTNYRCGDLGEPVSDSFEKVLSKTFDRRPRILQRRRRSN